MNRLVLAPLLALLGACFDPLYEDPSLIGEASWAVCCVRGQVDTCLCEEPGGCESSFRACASGTCAASLSDSCGGVKGSQDAGGVPADGGTSVDAGTGMDAGTSTDGGVSMDAGTSTDGGVDMDAGTDAGTDAGPQPTQGYEPCCDPSSHRVTTCHCAPSGCGTSPPFTPCAAARCALAGESCG
ncbi:hypothetical protein [Corallococcus aberystwythensis]|uniref:Uncharacterized protein n=1 Tax=Corallococcus aberystwythensis TaxID=2316722 RepID=A0A3A8QQ00_9BACT|nr:hypothetical protein [Corallococcus aberystwythensis]RKH70733.1 hypothetical protein D7W81_08815 [Corallococcus aberystwythensis]